MSDLLTCEICKADVPHWLGQHLQGVHGLSLAQYGDQYPGQPIISPRLAVIQGLTPAPRRAHPKIMPPVVKMVGLEFPVNLGVPESACLPLPEHYQIPAHGDLGQDVNYVFVALYQGRSIYTWGEPGTGKDAIYHYWSWMTRTPGIIKQVIPGTDIESWFFSRSFDEKGTAWEEGDVLKALRDGYLRDDGTRVPYLCLFSDLDRAQKDQAEYFRLIADSIEGRIQGPAGRTDKVLKGTRVAATANTAGGGDPRGRMVSSNPIDGSIMNRFNYKVQFHPMAWEDEEPIVKAKYPQLAARAPWVFDRMGRATKAIRAALAGANPLFYGEYSHRDVCHILMAASDLLLCSGAREVPQNLLQKAARVWIDGLPDDDARRQARNVIDGHLKGGMVNAGKPVANGDPVADI